MNLEDAKKQLKLAGTKLEHCKEYAAKMKKERDSYKAVLKKVVEIAGEGRPIDHLLLTNLYFPEMRQKAGGPTRKGHVFICSDSDSLTVGRGKSMNREEWTVSLEHVETQINEKGELVISILLDEHGNMRTKKNGVEVLIPTSHPSHTRITLATLSGGRANALHKQINKMQENRRKSKEKNDRTR